MIASNESPVNSTLVLGRADELVGGVLVGAHVANDTRTNDALIAYTRSALIVDVDELLGVAGGVDVAVCIAEELPATSPGAEDSEGDDENLIGHVCILLSIITAVNSTLVLIWAPRESNPGLLAVCFCRLPCLFVSIRGIQCASRYTSAHVGSYNLQGG